MNWLQNMDTLSLETKLEEFNDSILSESTLLYIDKDDEERNKLQQLFMLEKNTERHSQLNQSVNTLNEGNRTLNTPDRKNVRPQNQSSLNQRRNTTRPSIRR